MQIEQSILMLNFLFIFINVANILEANCLTSFFCSNNNSTKRAILFRSH